MEDIRARPYFPRKLQQMIALLIIRSSGHLTYNDRLHLIDRVENNMRYHNDVRMKFEGWPMPQGHKHSAEFFTRKIENLVAREEAAKAGKPLPVDPYLPVHPSKRALEDSFAYEDLDYYDGLNQSHSRY